MKSGKWLFLVLAFLAAVCMVLIGIGVGERSIASVLGAIVGLIVVMGTGFTMKKKWKEKGLL